MNRDRHAWRVVSWPIKAFPVVSDGRSSEDWLVSAVVSPASAFPATSAALARVAAAIAASVADVAALVVAASLHSPVAAPFAGVPAPAAAGASADPAVAAPATSPAVAGTTCPAQRCRCLPPAVGKSAGGR